MMHEPFVVIECDECGEKIELLLTEIVCQDTPAWDARNIPNLLERNGWSEIGTNTHRCRKCNKYKDMMDQEKEMQQDIEFFESMED